ncbi:MAG: type II toxin-antitoxin system RelE/ParE family toxin [Bryobacteraceae bacterium]|jgi:mRNA-degrading endonuclease RelE of RelBE toxin-antitoxin system
MKRFVGWTPAAKTQLRALDRQIAIEILHAIDRYMVNGEGDIKQLSTPLGGLRLRVGEWRVLFKPLKSENSILISKVAHRSVAYRA